MIGSYKYSLYSFGIVKCHSENKLSEHSTAWKYFQISKWDGQMTPSVCYECVPQTLTLASYWLSIYVLFFRGETHRLWQPARCHKLANKKARRPTICSLTICHSGATVPVSYEHYSFFGQHESTCDSIRFNSSFCIRNGWKLVKSWILLGISKEHIGACLLTFLFFR